MTKKEMIKMLKSLNVIAREKGNEEYRSGINFAIGYIATAIAHNDDYDYEKWNEKTNKILDKVKGDN